MRIGVNGAAGFIGRAVVHRLREGALARIDVLRPLDIRAAEVTGSPSKVTFESAPFAQPMLDASDALAAGFGGDVDVAALAEAVLAKIRRERYA